MSDSKSRRTGVLQGRPVFLSASIPTRSGFRRPSYAAIEIEEAVVSFARAVFLQDGILVFGAHPSISPLVASIAGEYITPHFRADEPPDVEEIGYLERRGPAVVIYQSHAYDDYLPDKTWELYRLGYASLIWCKAQGGERFNPKQKHVQCPLSLEFMRKAMFRKERPIAMVAIGGMEGVIDEAKLFWTDAESRNVRTIPPVWTLETTGGAAEKMAERFVGPHYHLRFVEREWQAINPTTISEQSYAPDPRAGSFLPYPLIMQWLVQQIGNQPVGAR